VLHILHTLEGDDDASYRVLFLVVLFLHYKIYPYVLEMCLRKTVEPHIMFHVQQRCLASAYYSQALRGSAAIERQMVELARPLVDIKANDLTEDYVSNVAI
jgi:hypothetical protein